MATQTIGVNPKTFERLIADKQQLIQWTQKLLDMLQYGTISEYTLKTLPDSRVLTYLQQLVMQDSNLLEEIRENKYRDKITEVTTYKAKTSDLLELDNAKPIIPTPEQLKTVRDHQIIMEETQNYQYDEDGKTVRVECSDVWVKITANKI